MHLVLLPPSIIRGVQLFVAPECLFINVFKSKITLRLLLLLCHQSRLGINKPGFGNFSLLAASPKVWPCICMGRGRWQREEQPWKFGFSLGISVPAVPESSTLTSGPKWGGRTLATALEQTGAPGSRAGRTFFFQTSFE